MKFKKPKPDSAPAPDTAELPAVSTETETNETPPSSSPKSFKKLTRNKLLIIIAAVVAVAGAAGVLFWKSDSHKPANKNAVQGGTKISKDITVSPRFTSVQAYANFQGSDWYAVEGGVFKITPNTTPIYFAHKDGVPFGAPTGLAVHGNKLWLSTQDGLAYLKDDGAGFTEVGVNGSTSQTNDHITNGQVYNDIYSNKLYASDFNNLYELNDADNSWKIVNFTGTGRPPSNLYSFAANKDFVVATSNHESTLIWVYDKKAGSWTLEKPDTIQDGVPNVFNLNDELFATGRTQGYDSCGGMGKVVATSVYHLDANGAWQPMTDFNKDIKRPEIVLAKHVKDPSVAFFTYPCTGDGTSTRYTAEYKNNVFSISNPKTLDPGTTAFGQDGEQQSLVDLLTKATGLYPFMHVLAVDKSGNLIYTFSNDVDNSSLSIPQGLAIAKGRSIASPDIIELPKNINIFNAIPILCDGTFSYLFAGEEENVEGPTGAWVSTKILKLDGTKLTDFVDLKKDVSEPKFACGGNKISWLGSMTVNQLDLTTKQMKTVGPKIGDMVLNSQGLVYPVANGDLWILFSVDPYSKDNSVFTLYYYDSAKSTTQKLATLTGRTGLAAGSSKYIWLSSASGTTGKQKLLLYDNKGAQVLAKEYFLPIGAVVTGGDANLTLITGNGYDSVFVRYQLFKLGVDGNETSLGIDNVVIRQIYDAVYDPVRTLVFDSGRNLVWVSDNEFGLFSIPL